MFMCARRIKKLTFGWPVVDMVVFFLVCENFRGRLDESFPHLCFFIFFFFFLKQRLAYTHQLHFVGQDQSTVA